MNDAIKSLIKFVLEVFLTFIFLNAHNFSFKYPDFVESIPHQTTFNPFHEVLQRSKLAKRQKQAEISQVSTKYHHPENFAQDKPDSLSDFVKTLSSNESANKEDYLLNYVFPRHYFFPVSKRRKDALRERVRGMFQFGYDGYMKYAYPLDELDPIKCTGRGPDTSNPDNININDVLGGYSLTLVDTLDTLAIVGNSSEFKASISKITKNLHFDLDTTVQVFESTIRVIGGLLSAYQINNNSPAALLKLAADLADRLLPAFDSPTYIPYPRVHLLSSTPNKTRKGIPPGAVGGILLEFTTLSRLTGNPKYENAARKAMLQLYNKRTVKGLFGSEINVETGQWEQSMAGIGAGTDSVYECLLKNYIAYGNTTDLATYVSLMRSVEKYIKPSPSDFDKELCFPYKNVNSRLGTLENTWVDALSAFFPGLLVLEGKDLKEAICMHAHYWAIVHSFQAFPERYNWNLGAADVKFWPLRPEFIESTYILYRATKLPFYLHVGEYFINILEERAKSKCGYGTLHDVTKAKSLEDRQESFFLSETLKYLYLLYDDDNFAHDPGWIFTTEAHLIKTQDRGKHTHHEARQRYQSYDFSASFQNGLKRQEDERWDKLIRENFSRNVQSTMNESSTYMCTDTAVDYRNYIQGSMMSMINQEFLPFKVFH